MIQRIQSIYLLLVAILMAVTTVSPIATFSNVKSGFSVDLGCIGIINEQVSFFTWGVITIAAIVALLSLINIFLYKKRKLQIKIGTINTLLILFFYVTAAVYYYVFCSQYGFVFTAIQYGATIPFIALIFNTLSILKIKKDERLVRSLDRIR